MLRRTFTSLLIAATFAAPGHTGESNTAGALSLTADQIGNLLRGNTIRGTWRGSGYTQYFAENGLTLYLPDGGAPSRGKWRVRDDTDQYGSWWENTGWTPYTVMMTNDGYAWVSGGALEPFRVLAGRQLDF